MALDYTPRDIASGFQTTESLDQNFADIQTALRDGLSRSGQSPNAMGADIDMQGRRIYNLPNAISNGEPVTYQQLIANLTPVEFAGYLQELQTSTDGQTVFTTANAYTPGLGALRVFVNGLLLPTTEYLEVDNNTVTFLTGLEAGDEVHFVITSFAAADYDTAATVQYQNYDGTYTSVQNAIDRLGTATNVSVTVGTGGDFATINAALEYLSVYRSRYIQGGVSGTITLLSGFVMAEEVHLPRGENLGWIKIVAQDPVVTIQRSALTTLLGQTYNEATTQTLGSHQYPLSTGCAFFGAKGAIMPTIGCLFSMDTSGETNRNYYGLALHSGSHATVLWGCGITNVIRPTPGRSGRGAAITHGSTLKGYGSIWDGCMIGVRVSNCSKVNVRNGSAKNCEFGIDVNGASEVSCQQMDLSGCTLHAVMALGHATARAAECDMTNCGVGGTTSTDYATIYADAGARVDANSSDISGGQRGIDAFGGALVTFSNGICTSMAGKLLSATNGAKIVADYCTISGCESEGTVAAGYGGEIVVRGATITNNPLVSGLYAYGGTIYAQEATITGSKNAAGDFDIRVRDNGQVFAFGANTTNGGGTAVAVANCSISRLNERTASGAVWTSNASILNGSKTHNFGSLAANASETTTVTVTGAELGDFVEDVSLSVDTAGADLRAWVSATNTVSVRLLNDTATDPLDLASGTLRVRVRKA